MMFDGFSFTGAEDISESAFNPATGNIDIASVTGRVEIIVTSTPQWTQGEVDGYDAEFAELVDEGAASPVEPRPVVTLNLQHCSASNTAGSTALGRPYTNTLTANPDYVFVRSGPSLGGVNFGGGGQEPDLDPVKIGLYCMITMGDENITTASFDLETGEIEIDEVTGPLVIKTWAGDSPD